MIVLQTFAHLQYQGALFNYLLNPAVEVTTFKATRLLTYFLDE